MAFDPCEMLLETLTSMRDSIAIARALKDSFTDRMDALFAAANNLLSPNLPRVPVFPTVGQLPSLRACFPDIDQLDDGNALNDMALKIRNRVSKEIATLRKDPSKRLNDVFDRYNDANTDVEGFIGEAETLIDQAECLACAVSSLKTDILADKAALIKSGGGLESPMISAKQDLLDTYRTDLGAIKTAVGL